jgi:hypothetical protein
MRSRLSGVMQRSLARPKARVRGAAALPPVRVARLGFGGLGLLVAFVGCSGDGAARFATASSLPAGERRPDGVAVDRVSEPPAFRDEAPSADGIVTLRTPLGLDVATAAVRRFFEAIVDEDAAALANLVRSGAMLHDTRATGQSRTQGLVPLWRLRFNKYDYGQLGSRTIFQESEVKSYRVEELDRLPLEVQHLVRGVSLEPTVVVLRVPIVTATVKNERLFGDEIYFWLRRHDDGYEIYQVAEDVPY